MKKLIWPLLALLLLCACAGNSGGPQETEPPRTQPPVTTTAPATTTPTTTAPPEPETTTEYAPPATNRGNDETALASLTQWAGEDTEGILSLLEEYFFSRGVQLKLVLGLGVTGEEGVEFARVQSALFDAEQSAHISEKVKAYEEERFAELYRRYNTDSTTVSIQANVEYAVLEFEQISKDECVLTAHEISYSQNTAPDSDPWRSAFASGHEMTFKRIDGRLVLVDDAYFDVIDTRPEDRRGSAQF